MSDTKVLHVIARMNVGGTARYVGELIKGIPNSKLATGFVQGQELEDKVMVEIPFIRVAHLGREISPINDIKAWLELRKIIKDLNPEIVHTHTFKAGLIGRLVPGKHRRIHTFHGHLFEDPSFSPISKVLITLIEKFLATRTETLISVGEKVGQEIRSKGIGKNKKWVSIPPGVRPLHKYDKIEARKKLGLPESELVIGWMARMTPVKNPYLFLEVARELPRITFAMAGGGDLFEEVKSMAPNNVRILGWADAAYFWSAVDIAVSTSDNEGMPIALIEAQMSGVPVIATDVGSVSEVIQNSKTGFLASSSITNFANFASALISQKEKFYEMSLLSTTLAKNNFNIENFLVNNYNLY